MQWRQQVTHVLTSYAVLNLLLGSEVCHGSHNLCKQSLEQEE